MKGIIIYKSKYGSTKQYAQWLHEETGFELCNSKDFSKDISKYDAIVIAASIHAGSLSLKRFLLDTWPLISEKRIAVLVTSGAGHQEVVKQILKDSLPQAVYGKLNIFPVGGRYVLGEMSFIDRTLIRIAAFFTNNPHAKKGMLEEKREVSRDNLQGIVEFVKAPPNAEGPA
ncbi:MAG: flavodoxin domain-containing protein [Spirochaetia bacterium]